MTIILFLDYLGTAVFAISGALAGVNKRFDLFGIIILGLVTAIGGGTLRDLLIGRTPVAWLTDINYLYAVLAGVVIAIIFRSKLDHVRKMIFTMDAIGLGLFTITGVDLGLEAGLHPLICILLGTTGAVFGGVIRDTLSNEIPLIFRNEIYASVSILGGALYFILTYLNCGTTASYIIVCSMIILLRICAVRFKWQLPKIEES